MRNTPLDEKHPYLIALGERVRLLRSRRGLSRKAAAARAQVSERHWANLESGMGNASILVLLQVAKALQCNMVSLKSPRKPVWHRANTLHSLVCVVRASPL